MSQHLIVVALGLLIVFFPPAPQGRHIVGGEGADRTVRIFVQPSEFFCRILGHPLNFETQDT